MISEGMRNMAAQLMTYGEVKPALMPTVLELLADFADQVEALERQAMPVSARMVPGDLPASGNVVALRRPR